MARRVDLEGRGGHAGNQHPVLGPAGARPPDRAGTLRVGQIRPPERMRCRGLKDRDGELGVGRRLGLDEQLTEES